MSRRNWRGFDAYLFDIDGTLLNSRDAVHYFAFCRVLTEVAGRPIDLSGVVAHGNVDTGILRDAFALAGVPDTVWRPHLPTLLQQMGEYCREHVSEMRIEPAPGVYQVLTLLQGRGARLGVATGNLRAIGELKLELPGLLSRFDFAAWSDGCEQREEVFARGLAMARSAAGLDAAVLVVGDTPADVRAAKANGVACLAVAGGVYSIAELAAEQPAWCYPSLVAALRDDP